MQRTNVAQTCRSMAPSPMTGSEAAQLERLFRVIADRHRIRILDLLANTTEPICVCEFQPALGLSQPAVSYHLGMLTRAGFLEKEKRGRFSFYRLVSGALEDLGRAVPGASARVEEPARKSSGEG